ncbi:NAD-dependent epimerase/dehydratase family protein [Dokdonella sp. MW10]|uniref:NAD-dependent epimerase/dehydratase family protein n=1 Tax=Dokdonella sp. MW10 TaxID=2992926 RepID=UPI003F8114AB
MAVLVTGATGYLGVALLRRLVADAVPDVRVLVRPGSDTRALDEAVAGADPVVTRVEGTLDTVEDAARALQGVSLVYHLAAAMRGDVAAIVHGTLTTSRHLRDAAAAMPAPPRIVLASSLSVYGTAVLDDGALVDETTPVEPSPARRDLYAYAKLEQERLFRASLARHGLPLVVLRPGVLYGRGRLAPVARVGFGPRRGVFVAVGGDNTLPLAHVDHCAAALVFAATHARFDGDTYDVVDEDPVSCRDYLSRWRRAHAPGLRVVTLPYAMLLRIAGLSERLRAWSRGRLPAPLTRYRVRATWKPLRYSGERLRALGFRAPGAREALERELP